MYRKFIIPADGYGSEKAKERKIGKTVMTEVVGRHIPTVQTKDGLRTAIKGEEIDPKSIQS